MDGGGGRGGGGRAAALPDDRGTVADQVHDPGLGRAVRRRLAGERRGAGDQRHGAAPGRHGDGPGGVRRGQGHRAAGARRLGDEVAAAGGDRPGERGDLPLRTGRRGAREVLDAEAADLERGGAGVGQLHEVPGQRRAGVAPAAVHLGDHRGGGRGRLGGGQGGHRERDGDGAGQQDGTGSGYLHGRCPNVGLRAKSYARRRSMTRRRRLNPRIARVSARCGVVG